MADAQAILVATDLSARCDRAVDRAFVLGRQLGADVVILHVLSEGKITPAIEDRLHYMLVNDFGDHARKATIVLESGSIPGKIAKVAREHNCSLVLTGVSRFNSPRDYVLGTTVDELVRQSHVPVLVVKRRPHETYGCILVAADIPNRLEGAALAATKLIPGAQIRLLQSYQPSFEGFMDRESTIPLAREEAEEAIEKVMAKLPEAVRAKAHSQASEGMLAKVIEDAMKEWDPELLVIESRERIGIAHAMTSERGRDPLVHDPIDVLVVRPC